MADNSRAMRTISVTGHRARPVRRVRTDPGQLARGANCWHLSNSVIKLRNIFHIQVDVVLPIPLAIAKVLLQFLNIFYTQADIALLSPVDIVNTKLLSLILLCTNFML